MSNIKADLHNDIDSVRTPRGIVSCIATWTRPDAAFSAGILSQMTLENINSEATKSCNDLNDYLKKTVRTNIFFCKLAGNLNLSSQIDGIIPLKHKHGNAHILHCFQRNVHALQDVC
jgi:hypothetical protein